MKINVIKACFTLVATLSSLSCFAQTDIADRWTDTALPLPKYNRLLVIALVPNTSDYSLGVMAEKALVKQLAATGIKAVSAHQQLGKDYLIHPNADTVISRIIRNDDDGVITLLLLTDQDDQKKIMEKKDSLPFYKKFEPYYTAWYNYHPVKNKKSRKNDQLIIVANMYNFSTKSLLYTAQSKFFTNPGNADNYKMFSQSIITDMKKRGPL